MVNSQPVQELVFTGVLCVKGGRAIHVLSLVKNDIFKAVYLSVAIKICLYM